jgi:hypothetical protein
MTPNLSEINSKLAAKGKRTHQNVLPVKGLGELRKATVKLQKKAKELERSVQELRDSKKVTVPASPTKKGRIHSAEESARLEKLYLAKEERGNPAKKDFVK